MRKGKETRPPRGKFGVGQTPTQELAEIRAAQAAGRTLDYERGRDYARLIEAETARRRARKAARRAQKIANAKRSRARRA